MAHNCLYSEIINIRKIENFSENLFWFWIHLFLRWLLHNKEQTKVYLYIQIDKIEVLVFDSYLLRINESCHDPELGCQVLTANLILNPSPLPPLTRCRKSEVFSPGWQGQVISLDWSRGGSNRRLFNLTVWSPGTHNIKYTDFKEIMLHSMEIFLLRN